MHYKVLRYYAVALIKKVSPKAYRFLKRMKFKYEAHSRKTSRAEAISRYGYFDGKKMREVLASVGIKRGGILFVHSSFNRFYNFMGTARDILLLLKEVVGPEGTLVMPAFPEYKHDGPYFFDVKKTPTDTGILCELLRRHNGSIRSLHPVHSCCAIGPLAEELLSEHHLDLFCCGRKSPLFKMIEYDGQILGLGVPRGFTTFFHVLEDIDTDNFPRPIYKEKPVTFRVISENGQELSVPVYQKNQRVMATMNLNRLAGHLSNRAYRDFSIFGVPAFIANTKLLYEELCALRDRGILLYD